MRNSFLTVSAIALLFVSCGGGSKQAEGNSNTEEMADDTTSKLANNGVINLEGELFSIPSPIHTAMLIQKTGAAYDKAILNPVANGNQYSTDFAKALNLGIYGADLGYVSMYSQSSDVASYLVHVKKLADDLGVTAAFDNKTLERINRNIQIKDSLLMLVGIAYRASDAFLKDNKRNDVSSLILAGGWIESLNFAISVHKTKSNEEIARRIAEQKQALGSIVKLLSKFESQAEFAPLVADLKDLATVYEGITTKYIYEKPVTDPAAKTTVINSRTEVSYTKEQIDQIAEKVKALRNKLINPTGKA